MRIGMVNAVNKLKRRCTGFMLLENHDHSLHLSGNHTVAVIAKCGEVPQSPALIVLSLLL